MMTATMRAMSWTAALGLALLACQPFNAAVDCANICSRYKDCFNSSYDSDGCASRCRSNAASDDNYYRSVDTCNACITDRACASATFNCASSCLNVVP
jgi:hypothetical protein